MMRSFVCEERRRIEDRMRTSGDRDRKKRKGRKGAEARLGRSRTIVKGQRNGSEAEEW